MAIPSNVFTLSATPSVRHYQLGACLGEGGFGQVYEAWDNQLCRKVAIKRLKDIASGAGLLKEARLAASLRHPAFVKIHSLEIIENSQSIVMELIEGRTLRKLITEACLNPNQSRNTIKQIALAMHEAHKAGLIHGDLKPSNIMCEADGTVRILDFGLARNIDRDATNSVLQTDPQGTIAYMAPERLHNAPLNASSDIYALGVMFYELLCGARPFPHLSGLALAAAHLQSSSDQWTWPQDISPEYAELIKAMTARQPEQRVTSMSEVAGKCEHNYPLHPSTKPLTFSVNKFLKHAKLMLFVLLMVSTLMIGGWMFTQHSLSTYAGLHPYSESTAMKLGLNALNFYERPGQLDEAEKQFSSILKHSPEHAGAAAGLSLTYSFRYLTDGEDEIWFQKAEAAAQRALQLNDQLALSQIAYAKVLDQHGEWDKALVALNKADTLDPDNLLAISERANLLINARRYDEALQLATLNLQRFPQERFFADEIGNVHFLRGNYLAAEHAFRQSLSIQPDVVLAYANLNAVLMAQGKSKEALHVLQQGLQVRPSAQLYTNLGNTLFMQGDYAGAAAAFENAVSPVKGNPQDYQGWANLAEILQWIPGRESDSGEAYRKARQLLAPQLKRAPDNSNLIAKSALFSARAGDKSGVAESLSRALQLAPDSAQINLEAGVAYELIGQRELALSAIHEAIKLGYPESFISAEPALTSLRRDPEFRRH